MCCQVSIPNLEDDFGSTLCDSTVLYMAMLHMTFCTVCHSMCQFCSPCAVFIVLRVVLWCVFQLGWLFQV